MDPRKLFLWLKTHPASKFTLDSIINKLGGDLSNDCHLQLQTTPRIHDFFPTDCDYPFEELVKSGVVGTFFDFLDREDMLLEFEAAWASTNVISGSTSELLKYAIGLNVLLKLVNLYKSSRDEFHQLALWDFGENGDSFKCSGLGPDDICHEFFLALDRLIDEADQCVLPIVSRTLYKFSAFLDPSFAKKGLLYSVLQKLIRSVDLEVLTDACWALANTYDSVDDIQVVFGLDACRRLFDLLTHHSSSVVIPVLFTLGKIVSGTDKQTQYVINQNVLPKLKDLLIVGNDDRTTKLACFIIATITSYGSKHVQAVIDANLVDPLINLLQREIDCKDDVVLAVLNCATNASLHQFMRHFNEGCIKQLCDLLSSGNFVIIQRCLALLDEILHRRESVKDGLDEYKNIIAEAGGLDNIRELKFHVDRLTSRWAVELIRKYWIKEEYEGLLPIELRCIC